MKKKMGLFFLSVFLTSALMLFTACGDGGGGNGDNGITPPPVCDVCNWEVRALTEYVEFEEDGVIHILPDAVYGTVQRVRRCTICGDMTYYIPADLGLTVPQGAVWVGPWLPDGEGSAIQIRWEVSDAIKARIQTGELNRLYLFLRPDIDFPVPNSTSTVVNASRTEGGTWRSRRPSHIDNVGPEVPSRWTSIDDVSFPLVTLINHVGGHREIDWNGDTFQFWIQNTGGIGRLQPIALFVGPGLPTDPPPPEPLPPQENVDVPMTFAGETQAVRLSQMGGRTTPVLNAQEEVIGFQFMKSDNHRASHVSFPVILPDSRVLSQFESVTFDFQSISGPNTPIALIARTAPITSMIAHTVAPTSGRIATGQVSVPHGNIIVANHRESPAPITLIIGDDPHGMGYLAAADAAGSSIYLSFYEHEVASTWRITNIVFNERGSCPDCGYNTLPCDCRCDDCGYRVCQCCPVCGAHPCVSDCCLICETDPCECPEPGEEVFSLADWFTVNSAVTEITSVGGVGGLGRSSSGTLITIVDNEINIRYQQGVSGTNSGSTHGLDIQIGGLSPAVHRYELHVTGRSIEEAGTQGIRIRNSTGAVTFGTAQFISNEFAITQEIPADTGGNLMRIQLNPGLTVNGTELNVRITDITITFIGPRN